MKQEADADGAVGAKSLTVAGAATALAKKNLAARGRQMTENAK
jgi:hypothetical protein